MLVELAGQFEFEIVDGALHRDDNPDEPDHGVAKGLFDRRRLPKGGGVQVGEDLLNQGGVVTAAGSLQQCHYSTTGQLPAACRGRRGCQHGQCCLVCEIRKCLQRLRIELQQHRS